MCLLICQAMIVVREWHLSPKVQGFFPRSANEKEADFLDQSNFDIQELHVVEHCLTFSADIYF